METMKVKVEDVKGERGDFKCVGGNGIKEEVGKFDFIFNHSTKFVLYRILLYCGSIVVNHTQYHLFFMFFHMLTRVVFLTQTILPSVL